MAVAFNRRNIFEVFFAIKLLLLICLFSGCSQKAIYFFSPPQAQIYPLTKSDSIAVIKTATIPESLKLSETVGFSAKKPKIKTLGAFATKKIALTNSKTSYFNSYTSYNDKLQLFSGASSGTKSFIGTQEKLQNIETKLNTARAKFPMPLFLVLSLILAILIALYLLLEAHSAQGPASLDFLLLLLIIPLAVWWLFLAFKGLGILVAPLLGWPVFWTSIALVIVAFGLLWVIVRLVDYIGGLINKRKRKRYEKKKNQPAQPPKWDKGLGS